ncbi:MAG: hypothetical protein WCN97_02420 [Thermoleophilia bacterium]
MTLPVAIGIVVLTMLVGSTLYVIYSRFAPQGGREHQTPTAVYAVTAGAMSLLIAFTMSLTFEQYLAAQQAATSEAEAVMSMSRAATYMDPSVGKPLRDELVCYAQGVVELKWPRLRDGDVALPPTMLSSLNRMDTILSNNVTAAGAGLGIWVGADEQRLDAHDQLVSAASDGVPPILWFLLIAGSAITIGSLFVYADRSKPSWGHAIVVIGPLFIAAAALVVIAFFDHPFADTPGAVTTDAMQMTLHKMTAMPIGKFPIPVCPQKL